MNEGHDSLESSESLIAAPFRACDMLFTMCVSLCGEGSFVCEAGYMVFIIAIGWGRKSHTVFHKQLYSSVLQEPCAHYDLDRGKLTQF